MSDIEVLHEMIKPAAKISLVGDGNKKTVTLNEPQQPKSTVTIVGIPESAIVIKVNLFRSPDTVFVGTKGECKRADFIIVADSLHKKSIVYIEMKLTRDSEKEIMQQLTGARCFMTYCQNLGKEFWERPEFLNDYNHRFVSIKHTGTQKRKTRHDRPTENHDSPARMLKISSPHRLEFNQLAGKV
jgi:hypothetical protein